MLCFNSNNTFAPLQRTLVGLAQVMASSAKRGGRLTSAIRRKIVKAKIKVPKFIYVFHRSEKGFTAVESLILLTALTCLFWLGMVSLSHFTFTTAEELASDIEGHMVEQGVAAYLTDGNTISEPFTITPYDQNVLDSYLATDLAYSWTIHVDGSVTLIRTR